MSACFVLHLSIAALFAAQSARALSASLNPRPSTVHNLEVGHTHILSTGPYKTLAHNISTAKRLGSDVITQELIEQTLARLNLNAATLWNDPSWSPAALQELYDAYSDVRLRVRGRLPTSKELTKYLQKEHADLTEEKVIRRIHILLKVLRHADIQLISNPHNTSIDLDYAIYDVLKNIKAERGGSIDEVLANPASVDKSFLQRLLNPDFKNPEFFSVSPALEPGQFIARQILVGRGRPDKIIGDSLGRLSKGIAALEAQRKILESEIRFDQEVAAAARVPGVNPKIPGTVFQELESHPGLYRHANEVFARKRTRDAQDKAVAYSLKIQGYKNTKAPGRPSHRRTLSFGEQIVAIITEKRINPYDFGKILHEIDSNPQKHDAAFRALAKTNGNARTTRIRRTLSKLGRVLILPNASWNQYQLVFDRALTRYSATHRLSALDVDKAKPIFEQHLREQAMAFQRHLATAHLPMQQHYARGLDSLLEESAKFRALTDAYYALTRDQQNLVLLKLVFLRHQKVEAEVHREIALIINEKHETRPAKIAYTLQRDNRFAIFFSRVPGEQVQAMIRERLRQTSSQ